MPIPPETPKGSHHLIDRNYEKLVELSRSSLLVMGRPRKKVREAILSHPYFEEWLARDPLRSHARLKDKIRFADRIITLALLE
jgi:hypothetical protein